LMKEKALLGVSLSAHPLDLFKQDQKCFSRSNLRDLMQLVDQKDIPVVCWLSDHFERTTKDDKRMVVYRLEDQWGELSPAQFADDLREPPPEKDTPVICWFKISRGFEGRPPRARLEKIMSLQDFRNQRLKALTLFVKHQEVLDHPVQNPKLYLAKLHEILNEHPGDTPYRLQLRFARATISVKAKGGIQISDHLLQNLKDLRPGCAGVRYQL